MISLRRIQSPAFAASLLLAVFSFQPAAFSAAPAAPHTLSYTNPVWDGYLADPHVFRASNGNYYAIGTGLRESAPHLRDEPTPGYTGTFPILRSPDLQTWELVGAALHSTVEPVVKKAHWAPEIAERDGKFFLFYSGDYKIRVALADRPEGPYTDTGKILLPKNGFNIDGHPFRDPVSGKWYLFFATKFKFPFTKPDGTPGEKRGTGLAVVQLGDDLMSVAGPVHRITTDFLEWQIFNFQVGDYCVEAPFVIYRDGKYHCFYSGGNWQTPTYGVGCLVADSITGPYVDRHSLERGAVVCTIPEKLIGPGHNSVILAPDGQTHLLAYHTWNPERTARQLCLDPLLWTTDGPRVHQPARGEKTISLPFIP